MTGKSDHSQPLRPWPVRQDAPAATACRALLALAAQLVIAAPAAAHVKWFAPYTVSEAPRAIGEVLSGTFLWFFLGSAAFVYVFFLADRTALRFQLLARLDQRLKQLDGLAFQIMRISAAVFFLSLWGWHLAFGSTVYLTPELKTDSSVVPWIHLALGLCALSSRLAPLVGIGIVALYVLAVRAYGAYHLLDYLIFPGTAYFFVVANLSSPKWRQSGFVVLFAATGLTLIWASVEKFAYPQWTYGLLLRNPDMLMGMSPQTYMILAGYIEFTVAFLLLGAASVGARAVALGLEAIFVLAIYKFGLIDAIGHLMIIAILTVMVVRGPTSSRNLLVLRDKAVWTEAYFMTGLYFLAFVMIFILYYGLHFQSYGV